MQTRLKQEQEHGLQISPSGHGGLKGEAQTSTPHSHDESQVQRPSFISAIRQILTKLE